jgi:hypothetical protein
VRRGGHHPELVVLIETPVFAAVGNGGSGGPIPSIRPAPSLVFAFRRMAGQPAEVRCGR